LKKNLKNNFIKKLDFEKENTNNRKKKQKKEKKKKKKRKKIIPELMGRGPNYST
jgi:hypothetical protein